MTEAGAVLFAVATCLLAGCTASAGSSGKSAPGDAVNVEFNVENATGEPVDRFGEGDTARFVFRVHNNGAAPRTLEFTFPPHRVRVLSEKGGTIWQAFEGRMFPQVMRSQELPPGESITFTVEWDTRGVAPGSYRAQPEFVGFVRPGGQLARNLPSVSIDID